MNLFNTIAGMASIISLFLAIVGGGGYWYFTTRKNRQQQNIKGNGNIQAGRDININGGKNDHG